MKEEVIIDSSGCLSKDKPRFSGEIIFQTYGLESCRFSKSKDLGALTRANFESQPATRTEMISNSGNEPSDKIKAVMSPEKGSGGVVSDFSRQGLLLTLRYIGEVRQNQLILSHDSIQEVSLNTTNRESVSISILPCESQGVR